MENSCKDHLFKRSHHLVPFEAILWSQMFAIFVFFLVSNLLLPTRYFGAIWFLICRPKWFHIWPYDNMVYIVQRLVAFNFPLLGNLVC